MSIPLLNVLNAALAHGDTLPVRKRAALYRDIAKVCGDEDEARELLQCAEELQSADKRCCEFNFSFSQKLSSFTQKPDSNDGIKSK